MCDIALCRIIRRSPIVDVKTHIFIAIAQFHCSNAIYIVDECCAAATEKKTDSVLMSVSGSSQLHSIPTHVVSFARVLCDFLRVPANFSNAHYAMSIISGILMVSIKSFINPCRGNESSARSIDLSVII